MPQVVWKKDLPASGDSGRAPGNLLLGGFSSAKVIYANLHMDDFYEYKAE